MTTKPGFERRTEATVSAEDVLVERWSPGQVEQAHVFYGHEPSAVELREMFQEITEESRYDCHGR